MRPLLPLFLAAGFLAVAITLARAQGEQLDLQPPISDAFPSENCIGGVHVKFPVLINPHIILRPEAMLRFIYIDQNPGMHEHASSGNGFADEQWHAHITEPGAHTPNNEPVASGGDGPAGGWSKNDADDTAGIFDDNGRGDARRQKAEMQNEVWTQKGLFDDALAHASDTGTTIIYTVPSRPKLQTATFDLPEGMLLGQFDGHISVLGIKEDSRAWSAGIRPRDQIQAMDGTPLKTLEDFQRAYSATLRNAKGGVTVYTMSVYRPDTSQTIPVQVAAPPSIPSFLSQ